ncbi:transcriptional regulator [Kribbella sp. NPDC048915]|uniref:transcriptional regulator n=1 Tax=Kribbella sp. NPDC048915 TaxID=3155148 RepID=UPI0033F5EE7E
MHRVLHAVRLLGFGSATAIARRFDLGHATVEDSLQDAQARGWTTYSSFAGTSGWSLTEQGRTENERLLRAELDEVPGGAGKVQQVYDEFLPLNALLQQACTDWQLRPTPTDPLAANDHTDAEWDAGVRHELEAVERALGGMVGQLSDVLPRFSGYDARFAAALRRGDVDRSDSDSCHRVWFELHEDLLATLNLQR